MALIQKPESRNISILQLIFADFGTDGTPVKVTIYSTAKADYDSYVFYLKAGKLVAAPGEDNSGDNGNDESDKDITFEEVSVDSFLAKYEAYRLLLKVDTINDISRDTYLGAIDYIMVGQHQYESCSYGSISDQQFKVGTTPEVMVWEKEKITLILLRMVSMLTKQVI